jgi:T4 RnlA family RNA ligase
MSKIPTYEECLRICLESEMFYEQKHIIEGYNVSVFNYRLSTYNDFLVNNAFELRGLTFVFNEDGNLFSNYPLLEKFFNLNENESTQFDLIKNKKIKSIYQKEDGSVISFIKLPNGKIIAKSKNSFISDQALMAQKIYDSDKEINFYVSFWLDKGLNPIFELVSPKNRIVVNYNDTQLILLGLRSNDGLYLDINSYDLRKPDKFSFSLQDLMNLQTKLENIEGWVVEFVDGQKIKIKTDWYFNLHRILTDYSKREDYLIDMILDEKIDDLLCQIPHGSESRIFVEEVIEKTNKGINLISNEIDLLVSKFTDRKSFALEYLKAPYFYLSMAVINGKPKYEVIKDFLKKETYRLSQARTWLDSIS